MSSGRNPGYWYVLRLSVGRASSRAGSSVASPHQTVSLPNPGHCPDSKSAGFSAVFVSIFCRQPQKLPVSYYVYRIFKSHERRTRLSVLSDNRDYHSRVPDTGTIRMGTISSQGPVRKNSGSTGSSPHGLIRARKQRCAYPGRRKCEYQPAPACTTTGWRYQCELRRC